MRFHINIKVYKLWRHYRAFDGQYCILGGGLQEWVILMANFMSYHNILFNNG
jgi:hypothetical protein